MAETIFGVKVQGRKGKWLLVAGMAAALMAVILFCEEDAPAAPARKAPDETASAEATNSPRAASRPKEAKRKAPRWSRAAVPALEEAVVDDPFAMSTEVRQLLGLEAEPNASAAVPNASAQQQSHAQAAQTIAQWRSSGVSMIVTTATGKAALVGSRILREGQVVDGVRVVAIDQGGIVVEPAGVPAERKR